MIEWFNITVLHCSFAKVYKDLNWCKLASDAINKYEIFFNTYWFLPTLHKEIWENLWSFILCNLRISINLEYTSWLKMDFIDLTSKNNKERNMGTLKFCQQNQGNITMSINLEFGYFVFSWIASYIYVGIMSFTCPFGIIPSIFGLKFTTNTLCVQWSTSLT